MTVDEIRSPSDVAPTTLAATPSPASSHSENDGSSCPGCLALSRRVTRLEQELAVWIVAAAHPVLSTTMCYWIILLHGELPNFNEPRDPMPHAANRLVTSSVQFQLRANLPTKHPG